jgi:hypothetical protein
MFYIVLAKVSLDIDNKIQLAAAAAAAAEGDSAAQAATIECVICSHTVVKYLIP